MWANQVDLKGTGSGSMTYSLAEQVGQGGLIVSFEFNKERHESVAGLFENLGVNSVKFPKKILSSKCAGIGIRLFRV